MIVSYKSHTVERKSGEIGHEKGIGRWPVKPEVAGSSPVRSATKNRDSASRRALSKEGVLFCILFVYLILPDFTCSFRTNFVQSPVAGNLKAHSAFRGVGLFLLPTWRRNEREA